MGVVYLAEHMQLGRHVALKLLASTLAASQGFRDRFVRESRLAASLDHPNIVPVYDAGEADGLLYIAMRYVEGSDLATVLGQEGRLAPERALSIVEQVAGALDAAHARGLVHRDVKPANVLIEGERCYLTDFGLTKPVEGGTALTDPGHFVGTVKYVAPEQITGGAVDARTDVYSLGCVVHECLTGEPPFRRDSDIATVYAHLEEQPPRPSELREELPPAIDPVISWALAKDPGGRFPSCGEFAAAMRLALTPRPAAGTAAGTAPAPTVQAAPPKATAEPAAPGARRVPLRLLGAGLAALAVVVVAAVLVLGGDDDPDEPEPAPPAARELQGIRVAVGDEPVGVALRDGRLWVTNSGDSTVSLLDASSRRRLREPVPVGAGPLAVSVAGGNAWVANSADGTISRLDARTGDRLGEPIEVGVAPSGLAIGIGNASLWVANAGDGTVSRILVATSRVIDTVRVGDEPAGIATTPTNVWVANAADGTLSRIEAKSGVVAGDPVRVGRRPQGIAISGGVIWVANSGDGTVSRLDAGGRPLGPAVRVGGQPVGVAVGDRFVWVTNEANGTVTRIDPDTGRVVGRPIRVAERPAGVRAGGGRVFIADREGGSVVVLRE